jgi:hypothetical protein
LEHSKDSIKTEDEPPAKASDGELSHPIQRIGTKLSLKNITEMTEREKDSSDGISSDSSDDEKQNESEEEKTSEQKMADAEEKEK